MTTAYLVAAALAAAAWAEPKKKLDLGGLLGGPAVPGPSAGPKDDAGAPAREAILAALDVFDENAATALRCWAPDLGRLAKNNPSGAPEELKEEHVKQATAFYRALLGAKKIDTGGSAERGAAGTWAPAIEGGRITGGEFRVKAPAREAAAAQGWGAARTLYDGGNSILHETAHMLYSYFSWERGASSQSQPSRLSQFKVYYLADGGSPAGYCRDGTCPFKSCSADDIRCWLYTLSDGAHGDKGYTGNEHCARVISADLGNQTSGAALKRVLAPLTRASGS